MTGGIVDFYYMFKGISLETFKRNRLIDYDGSVYNFLTPFVTLVNV